MVSESKSICPFNNYKKFIKFGFYPLTNFTELLSEKLLRNKEKLLIYTYIFNNLLQKTILI